jgi:hemolysin D
VKASIEKVEMSLPLLTEQRDIRASLLQNQYGSRLSYLQIQQQLVEAQHELEGDRQKLEEGVQALAALDRQKAEATAEYRKGLLTDLAKAELSASKHDEEMKKAVLKRALRTSASTIRGSRSRSRSRPSPSPATGCCPAR